MAKLVNLLAWRYIKGAHQEHSIAIMIKICFGGILIGSFALSLILCIMNGFEQVTHAKLRGIHADIIIRSYNNSLQVNRVAQVLHDEFPQVHAYSPTTIQQVIVQGQNSHDITHVVALQGIDPTTAQAIHSLEQKITACVQTTTNLATMLQGESVIIGSSLAKALDIIPGNPITLLFANDEQIQGGKVTFEHYSVIVSATFMTGIDEFDSNLIFCSLDLIKKLWPDMGITQINLRVAPTENHDELVTNLRKRFRLEVFSWKDLYPALVAALKLDKYVMFFILTLIILVASANIISLQFMYLLQKRGDIALLKSMGMTDAAIRSVFLLTGTIIASTGTCIGLLLAALCGLVLQHYPFITLPDAYYVTHLPIAMEWYIFVLVFIVGMALSFGAIWLPTRSISTLSISSILRHEA